MTVPAAGEPCGDGRRPGAVGCALCGEALTAADAVVRCPACRTDFHEECWSFAGGRCARLGCMGRSAQPPGTAVPGGLAALPVAPPAAALRIGEAEIDAVRPQRSPVQGDDLLAGVWATPLLAAAAGLVCGLALALVFHAAEAVLRWSMGARFDQDLSLHALAFANRAGWWLWAAAGAGYGLLHRRYLAGRLRHLYPPLRAVLAAAVVGSLVLALGHLILLPAYRWPGSLWGLPAALAWLPDPLGWSLLAVVLVRVLRGYTWSTNLFALAGQALRLTAIAGVNGAANALLGGLAGLCLGWLLGCGGELLWPVHGLRARAAHCGLAALANLGFLAGAILVGRRRPRRRGGAPPAVDRH